MAKRRFQGDDPSVVNKAVREELDSLRTQFELLLVKMDADFGDVSNASTDYTSTLGGVVNTIEVG